MTIATEKAGPQPIEKIFAMQHGSGENSYAKNSSIQQHGLKNIIAPELHDALDKLRLPRDGQPVVVADLGCSTGLNTVNNMNLILQKLKQRFTDEATGSTSSVFPDFQVFFNDLPSNDFNYLFQLLSDQRNSLDYFAAGVPGSFYGRLFPRSSVHVFFSSYCLHWMSKVPDALLDKKSPAFNEGDMWMIHRRPEVGAAYKHQADLDLRDFLHARAEEMVPGGLLFALFNCRSSTSPTQQWPENSLAIDVWRCMDESWDTMVSQAHITKEQRDTFNVPLYNRSLEEVHEAIQGCGSAFRVEKVIVRKTGGAKISDFWPDTPPSELGKKHLSFMKSLHGPLVEAHIGKELAVVFWNNVELKLLESRIGDTLTKLEKDPDHKQHIDLSIVILIRT